MYWSIYTWGEGGGILFVQRSTSFSHELGDAFQIFCCVLLKRYFFSSSGSMQKPFQLLPLNEVVCLRQVDNRVALVWFCGTRVWF